MVGLTDLSAQQWDHRWQSALVQAMGPVRGLKLTRGELLKTGEGGMLAVTGALPGDEVVLDEHSISGSDPWVLRWLPLSKRNRDATLRQLIASASTLDERLDITPTSPVVPADEELLRARLGRWAHFVASDSAPGAFDFYLRCEGLDEFAARRGLGPVQLSDEVPLPNWAMTLGEAVFEACYDPLPGLFNPRRPIPFESLLLPFVHVYFRRVHAAASAARRLLTPVAEVTLARNLLEALSTLARDVLYDEFCRYRLDDFAPLAPFLFSEPDPLYRRFEDQMRAGGLLAVFEAYPVLARRLAVQTELFALTVGEFLRRLAADLPAICRLWETKDPGLVTAVRAGLSDPHRGGRQVLALTFANGLRLIYKPKDLGIDVAYNAFLRWLNAAGAPIVLRPLRVLNCETHGWVEYAEPASCADRAGVTRYYQRAGALACLIHLLQGSDCHAENLIAAGEDPVLVDCETLLDPWPRAADPPGGGDPQRARLNRLMRDSVLTTGLLPSLGEEDERTFSTPGLCHTIVLQIRKRTNRWMHINTDRMAVDQVRLQPSVADNLPRVDGIPVDVGECVEPLVAGFSAMYRFLMAQRSALLALESPLSAFRGRFVRFLFRSTHLYGVISGLAARTTALTDGVDHSLFFEMLARSFLNSAQTSVSWPILAAERSALLRGDVPFFGARTDETALLLENGERVEDYFICPSYDAVQAKLRNLNEQDLDFQVGLIRAGIAVYADLQGREAAAAAWQA